MLTKNELKLTHHNHPYPLFTLGFTHNTVHPMGVEKCLMTVIYHYYIIQSIFTTLKICTTTELYTFPIILYIVVGTVCSLSNCILSLTNIHLSFLHVFPQLISFQYGVIFYCLDVLQFLYLFKLLGCFQVLEILSDILVIQHSYYI